MGLVKKERSSFLYTDLISCMASFGRPLRLSPTKLSPLINAGLSYAGLSYAELSPLSELKAMNRQGTGSAQRTEELQQIEEVEGLE